MWITFCSGTDEADVDETRYESEPAAWSDLRG